jgi:hypothetical protein
MPNPSPKDKQVFTESLKGLKTAKDRFGTPIIAGEIIAYATVQYQSPIMKVAKILEVKRKDSTKSVRHGDDWVDIPDQKISLRVQGAHKSSWNQEGEWALQQKSSLKKIENVIVLTDPTEEILYLFKDVE